LVRALLELQRAELGIVILIRAATGLVFLSMIIFILWRNREPVAARIRESSTGCSDGAALLRNHLATFWHLDDMNWKSTLLVAHIWVVAYIVEPLILILIEPRSPAANAAVPAELSEGPVSLGLRIILAGIYIAGVTIAAVLFINPQLAETRWPWLLDPFNARIMAAWPAACAVWAATMYFRKDWVEIKMGVQGLILYIAGLFVVWLITLSQYDMARKNVLQYGIISGVMTVLLLFFYYRQEVARRRLQTQK